MARKEDAEVEHRLDYCHPDRMKIAFKISTGLADIYTLPQEL